MSYRITTPEFQITSTVGCDFVTDEVADTVVLTGFLDGVGVMVPQDGPQRVRLEMDVFTGWCRVTGERLTVRWNFDADSRLGAMSMLRDMVRNVVWASENADEMVAA